MTWHWQNYADALQDYGPTVPAVVRATPCIATVACLLLGYPLAYAIAFKAGRWKNLMLVAGHRAVLHQLPGPHAVVEAAARRQRLRRRRPATRCRSLGEDGRLLATPFAVITGLTYNFLPFMVLPLYASLEKIDPRLIEAGGDLYASPFTAFRKVTLPLSMPGLVAGTLLTFIPACGRLHQRRAAREPEAPG